MFIAYHVNGKESRGITLQNARKGITHLCMQLQYVNFFYNMISKLLISFIIFYKIFNMYFILLLD